MRGVVESWDPARGRGWITPVQDPDRPPPRVVPSARIEVERRVLSPSAAGKLRVGQRVAFVYRPPESSQQFGHAEAVVALDDEPALRYGRSS